MGSSNAQLDVNGMIDRLIASGHASSSSKSLCLNKTAISAICAAARDLFLSQPPLLNLVTPIKIVGDIRGQYDDLIQMFELCGFPPNSNYLFLGNYVDGGEKSLETILLLLCYKIKYPKNCFLLRGTHECAKLTRGAKLSACPGIAS
jgi:serine/threonine-protein phosphatase PP1 catalytic subunit